MSKLAETLTEAEFEAIMKATKNNRHKAAFGLGFYQGMRVSEVAGERLHLSVCCSQEIKILKKKENNKKITFYLCPQCNKSYKQDQYIESKTEWQIPPLDQSNIDYNQRIIKIKNAKGSKDRNIPIDPKMMKGLKFVPVECGIRALQIAFKKALKRANVTKDLHFHSLRHSCATNLLNVKKWNIRQVQQFLGHANINTTQIYTHVSPQDLVDLMWGGK